MNQKTSIIVFGSGTGTNFDALCKQCSNYQIAALVCNLHDAGIIDIAKRNHIPTFVIPHQGLSRAEHEKKIEAVLKQLSYDWIVLAGYMRIFSKEFIQKFWNAEKNVSKLINIHPSLLPAFPGLNAYAQAFQYGVKVTGVSIHFVAAGVDDGPMIEQRAFEITDEDTVETVTQRGLNLEHQLYAETLKKLFTSPWRLEETEGRSKVVWR